MKVILYIALWKRQKLSKLIVHHINQLYREGRKKGVQLDVHYIWTNEEDLDNYTEHLLPQWSENYSENLPLGRKFNSGLKYVVNRGYDYLMQLGSDDTLRHDFWDYALPYMEQKAEILGCKNLRIVDFGTKNEKLRSFNDVFGAGRLMRMDLVEKASNVYKCRSKVSDTSGLRKGAPCIVPKSKFRPKMHEKVGEGWELWENGRMSGLDFNSECNLMARTYIFKPIAIDQDQYLATDYKTGDNIHGFEKF